MVAELAKRFAFPFEEAAAFLKAEYPALADRERCANCGSSMCAYEYAHDATSATLLVAMARAVARALEAGVPFTEANRVHVQREVNRLYGYAVASATTRARYLGLVAKVRGKRGRHDQAAGWLVTRRGWKFLRGEPVPATVRVFRGEIVGRAAEGDTITLAGALARRPKPRKGAAPFEAPQTSADEWKELAFRMIPIAPDDQF